MDEMMQFPNTVEEFMEKYKIVDKGQVYTNGAELIPIFRMKQWFEHQANVSRWIPVTERLPEPKAPSQKREWFITSNQYGGVTQTCYEFEDGVFCKGWQTNFEILAWQPLPEPYKEGEQNE